MEDESMQAEQHARVLNAAPGVIVGSRWRHRASGHLMTVTAFWNDTAIVRCDDGLNLVFPSGDLHEWYKPDATPEPPGSAAPDHDPVNHPAHYTSHPAKCECGAGIECITITRHCNFCIGNAIKYLWRAGLKGDAIEDLRKAAWYINDEIARLEKEATR